MCVKALSYSRLPSDKCRKNGGNRKPSYDTIRLMIYSGRGSTMNAKADEWRLRRTRMLVSPQKISPQNAYHYKREK